MQALCVNWSNLKLPWVDLDWLIDISCQITELDLSANCLVSLPSVIPWGLINLRKLSLADNQLTELPSVQSSDEIICTRCVCWKSLATGVFASILLMPDWVISVITGCSRSMYPATGSLLSLLDSYILKTLKNSSLPKTIWRSYLTRKTVRAVPCYACISRPDL